MAQTIQDLIDSGKERFSCKMKIMSTTAHPYEATNTVNFSSLDDAAKAMDSDEYIAEWKETMRKIYFAEGIYVINSAKEEIYLSPFAVETIKFEVTIA